METRLSFAIESEQLQRVKHVAESKGMTLEEYSKSMVMLESDGLAFLDEVRNIESTGKLNASASMNEILNAIEQWLSRATFLIGCASNLQKNVGQKIAGIEEKLNKLRSGLEFLRDEIQTPQLDLAFEIDEQQKRPKQLENS